MFVCVNRASTKLKQVLGGSLMDQFLKLGEALASMARIMAQKKGLSQQV
ncbi:MAG: hypothetical protein ACLTXC_09540 [Turicibacter sp.]